MNKKFLSAVLFGALMVSSTGTFVSCKDYDDDIKDLQGQINSNKDAIAALQKLVGEGKWVTAITPVENGFTVTMSDGTTQTVTAIKGQDGKDGTEWTIGEDGFWYKDGEKTENKAIAENGVTAPSPKINADGMWVVYEWDATKGEFVEKVTEIPAQGTGAYYVEKDGVIYLHIADESGKFGEIALPATSDAFVVELPASAAKISFEFATWNAKTGSDAYKALLAKYPEIGKIAKDSLVKQGGNLPLLVSPASVELTDKMSYELLNLKGETVDIKVASPTRGLPSNVEMDNTTMITRSTSNNGFWTLQITPSLNEKGTAYVTSEDKALALAVTNEKGTTVNTPYGYFINANEVTSNVELDEKVSSQDGDGKMTRSAEYAETIDLFGLDKDGNSPIALANEYLGHCLVELTEPVEIEKYGLSIDENNILTIEKMPTDQSIKINVKITALGLNGSTIVKEEKITILQKFTSDVKLADQPVTLKADGKDSEIRWNIADLKFTAVQLEKFVKAEKTITLTREDKDGKYIAFFDNKIKCYDAKGKETSDYKNAVTFGFNVNGSTKDDTRILTGGTYTGEQILPKDYTITLTAKEGTSRLFTADAILKVSNPSEDAIKLVAEFVENNTLQAVGIVNPINTIKAGRAIVYDLNKGIVASKFIDIDKYVDVDYEAYVESGKEDETDMASQNWFEDNKNPQNLYVYAYHEENAETNPAKFGRLETTRNIRIEYHLFDNENNKDVFEFPVTVKSAVYSEKPETVITMEDKLSAVFGGDKETNLIKVANITKAVLAAGPDMGKEYDLFNVAGSAVPKKFDNYASPITQKEGSFEYVLNSNQNGLVQIDKEDLLAFGFAPSTLDKNKKFYLGTAYDFQKDQDYATAITLTELWNEVYDYNVYVSEVTENKQPIENTYKLDATVYNALTTAQKAKVDLFKKYAAKAAFVQVEYTYPAVDSDVDYTLLDEEAKVEFVDKAEGEKFAEISGSTIKARLANGVAVPGGKAVVPFKLTINDAWGKTMVYEFSATFTTK